MDNKICTNCGHANLNNSDTNFCVNCGKSLDDTLNSPISEEVKFNMKNKRKKQRYSKLEKIFTIVFFAPIIIKMICENKGVIISDLMSNLMNIIFFILEIVIIIYARIKHPEISFFRNVVWLVIILLAIRLFLILLASLSII